MPAMSWQKWGQSKFPNQWKFTLTPFFLRARPCIAAFVYIHFDRFRFLQKKIHKGELQ